MGVFIFFVKGNLFMSCSGKRYATGDAGAMGCNPNPKTSLRSLYCRKGISPKAEMMKAAFIRG
jgi:hypothetical protein